MKNIILALFAVVIITGCTTPQRMQLSWDFYDTKSGWNFTIREKGNMEGDCADFAFTLQYEIGGNVYFIESFGSGVRGYPLFTNHAVLCKDGRCYDQYRSFSYSRLKETFGASMHNINRYEYTVFNERTGVVVKNKP
jgi:hypothetical protein